MENEERLEPAEDIIEQPTEEIVETTEPVNEEVLDTAESNEKVVDDVAEETSEETVEEKPKKLSRRKRRRLKWLAFDPEHDIKYRGPFSYRTLRIFSFLFLSLSQLGAFLTFVCTRDAGYAAKLGTAAQILSSLKSVMMPLFLIASFSLLLNKSRKFSSQLLMYGGFAVLVFLFFILVHDRYLIGLAMKITDSDRESARELLDSLIGGFSNSGYISFNIFMDLFLCTLFVCFLTYKPKRVFIGKKLIIFRLFAFLPVLYELACLIMKALTAIDIMTMPVYMFPFLTTKPPMTFVVFVVLTSYLTIRGRIYNKHGLSSVDYDVFLKSKRNSWNFSVFSSVMIAIAVVLDGILLVVISAAYLPHFMSEDVTETILKSISVVHEMGFGASIPMALVIPFILLFSYTRTHKNTLIDLIIPILGIVFLFLIMLEELYQVLGYGIGMLDGILAE